MTTLLSADGAFGGPLRVAATLCDGLAQRGHDVVLATGWDGVAETAGLAGDATVRGFASHQLVPGSGFAGLVAPGLWRWLRDEVERADVLHVHLGRDLTSSVAALLGVRSRTPVVVQTHGMVLTDPRPRAQLFDRVLLRRVLRRTAQAFALTEVELASLVLLGAPVAERLTNGVAIPEDARGAATSNGPEGRPDILFCARLQERKRPTAFVRAAALALDGGADATFTLVGPDEGEADAVRLEIDRLGVAERVRWDGPLAYGAVLDRMRQAAVYVLPSVDEPFGMSLLEAMSVGVPCVTTDSIGIAGELLADDACVVTDGSEAAMAAAVSVLLSDPAGAGALGERGRACAARRFSIAASVERVEAAYRDAAGAGPSARLSL